MFSSPLPVWRSLLYVPAHVPRYVAKAEVCGADAVILDLEDGVPPEQKAQARGGLAEAIPRLARIGYDVLVRVNGPLEPMAADLRAAVLAGAAGVVLPKVRGAAHLEAIDEQLGLLEDACGAPLGQTRIIAIIETPRAFEVMSDIARASPRIAALMLGGGDFALSCDSRASAEVLRVPKQLLVIAARAAGILPLGLTGGLDVLDDLDAFERNLKRLPESLAGRNIKLRPHAKSHKCPEIAQRQLAAGAVGVCCQKVSEAEAMVNGGIRDILIANEVVGAAKLKSLAALARRVRNDDEFQLQLPPPRG